MEENTLENDEFDDFEEIEGVDVECIEKDGNKIIQFKVDPSSSRVFSLAGARQADPGKVERREES